VTRRRGRRRKKLLDDLKDRRGYSHLKEEALDRTMWRNRVGRSFGPVVRQNTERIKIVSAETFSSRVRPAMEEVAGSSQRTVLMSGNKNHIPDPIFTVINVKMTNLI
jgi:hypothetical protein